VLRALAIPDEGGFVRDRDGGGARCPLLLLLLLLLLRTDAA
jgi:hypothetical protein